MVSRMHKLFMDRYRRYYENIFFKYFLHRIARKRLKDYYTTLTEQEVIASRKSDTLIVMGSGYSINDLTKNDIKKFEDHDIFAFSGFFEFNEFIRIDYYLAREFFVYNNNMSTEEMKKNGMFLYFFADKVNKSKSSDRIIFFFQVELCSEIINLLLAHKMLMPLIKIFPFRNPINRIFRYPWKGIRTLLHCGGTLTDVVHAGYGMGYKRIVLVGIDLYDRNHFWLPKDVTSKVDKERNAQSQEKHNMADDSIRVFKKWNAFLSEKGVRLYVYNPKSLLTEVLPTISAEEL